MVGTVLLVSMPADGTTRLVADALARRRATVVWFDLADFPLAADLAVSGPPWRGTVATPGGSFAPDEVCGVLYRRPTGYRFPREMSDLNRQFAATEARVGLGGLLAGVDCRWIVHPARAADAEFKPVQLQVASKLGLSTPRTLLTNQPEAAQRFAVEVAGPVVYKTLHGLSVERGDGENLIVHTTVVDPGDLADESIRLTCHQFQEQIPKRYDLRVTMVGNRCFAVAIEPGSPASQVDFRADYGSLTYRPVTIERRLHRQLRAYLDHFDLAFGAFDLIVTPDGRTVWLECNPNGQWGWIEETTGLPISEAVADYLLGD